MAATPSALLEAVLFAEGGPLSKNKLVALLGVSESTLAEAASELHQSLSGRGLALFETPGELELRTAPAASSVIEKLREGELTRDLGKAGQETLAIILYQDGASRSEIDWIRGVNSGQTIRSLMLRGLVNRIDDPADKRRFRYEATTEALAHLGVSRIEELPRYEELRKGAAEALAAATEETV